MAKRKGLLPPTHDPKKLFPMPKTLGGSFQKSNASTEAVTGQKRHLPATEKAAGGFSLLGARVSAKKDKKK